MEPLKIHHRVQDAYQVFCFEHDARLPYEAIQQQPLSPVPGKGVVLSGRSPTWLFAWAVAQAMDTPWVAIYDPRVGGALVVHSRVSEPTVGTLVPVPAEHVLLEVPPDKQPETRAQTGVGQPRIALVGPPHSGKSVVGYALDRALEERLPGETFFLRAVPDGEGNWYAELPPRRADIFRIKGRWDEPFVQQIEKEIQTLGQTKTLTLVDTGGKIDSYTYRILRACSHAIVVSSRPEVVAEWIGAIKAAEADLLAVVHTSLEVVSEVLEPGPPMILHIGPTERGKHPAIPEVLIEHLLHLT